MSVASIHYTNLRLLDEFIKKEVGLKSVSIPILNCVLLTCFFISFSKKEEKSAEYCLVLIKKRKKVLFFHAI